MPLLINCTTSSTAFADRGAGEAERILDRIKRQISEGQSQGLVRDTNGIEIGDWHLTIDAEPG